MNRSMRWCARVLFAQSDRLVLLLLLSAFLLNSPKAARAQDWNGSESDLWSNASNWTPNVVPNSPTANVTINNTLNNPVLIDTSPQIANLTLSNSSNSVTIQMSRDLTMFGSGGSTMISNAGSITISPNANLVLTTDTTLQGGGSVTLSSATIFSLGLATLTNVNHTIQGTGFIFATVSNSTLVPFQNGTLQANAGNTLQLANLTNFILHGPIDSTPSLVGGNYNVFSGTMQLDNASAIATNVGASILLDGTSGTPQITGGSSTDILRGFLSQNFGSFTIQKGVSFTSATNSNGVFINSGAMTIGANSTFTVGGSNRYIQTSGTTTLGAPSSVLAAAAGIELADPGTFQGFGTVQSGILDNVDGTVMPGVPGISGVLTVTGIYTNVSELFIQIGGPDTLHGLSQLDVGTAELGGTLDVRLINGFMPTNGEEFVILTSGGLSGTFNDNIIHDGNVTWLVEYSPPGFANDVVLIAQVGGTVPEPSSWLLLGLGLAGVGAYAVAPHRRSPR